nr:MAG TPA: PGDYG protein [Caudoviricetes sp.]
MAKYRKKPIEIEAYRWIDNISATEFPDFPEWLAEAYLNGYIYWDVYGGGEVSQIHIETPEGNMIARKGDYIIKGVKGELYPCKPDIFEMTYEEVIE